MAARLKQEKDRIQSILRQKFADETMRAFDLKPNTDPMKRSNIWEKFNIVHQRGGPRHTFDSSEFVACKACKVVYAFTSAIGTSTISSHKCSASMSDVGTIREHCTHGKPSMHDEKRITVALADFCAMNLRPFSIVQGAGFKKLMQTVLDVAVAHNKCFLVEDVLMAPINVRKNVETRVDYGQEKLKELLKQHLSLEVYMACTLDLWSDDIKKVSYMFIIAHYIDEQFVLYDRTLHVKPLQDISHTAIMVKDEFEEGLATFDLNEFDSSQFIVVSDSGSNCNGMEGIRAKFDWYPCLDHRVATSLTTVLNKTVMQVDGVRCAPFYRHFHAAPELFQMIDDAKALVVYVKQSNLQHKLTKTLKQENVTRWNSLLRCLKSVEVVLLELIELLQARNGLMRVVCIPQELLKEFIVFLSEFELATLALEKFEPTLHKAVYWHHRLLAHLDVIKKDMSDDDGNIIAKADSKAIAAIKLIMKPVFDDKFVLETIHVVAALLDPAQKHRLHKFGVVAAQLQAGQNSLKDYMNYIGASGHKNELNVVSQPIPTKKRRTRSSAMTLYSDDEEDNEIDNIQSSEISDNLDIQVQVELEKYMAYKMGKEDRARIFSVRELAENRKKLPLGSDHVNDFHVLTWWKMSGQIMFPIMARVAHSILCVPASSAKSENNFSDA